MKTVETPRMLTGWPIKLAIAALCLAVVGCGDDTPTGPSSVSPPTTSAPPAPAPSTTQPVPLVVATSASKGWNSIRVNVDGTFLGTLNANVNSISGCSAIAGTQLRMMVMPGNHTITATTDRGSSWNETVVVPNNLTSNQCWTLTLTCSNGDCSPTPTPTPAPAPRPSPAPTPSPTPTPSPSPSPIPSTPVSISISQDRLPFSSTTVSTSSLEYWQVTIKSIGTIPIQLSSITSSNASEFPVTTTCPTPGSLSVGASCSLTVRFRPSATGTRSSQIVVRTSNANTVTITATGTGIR